jgi:hypothetical protein
MLPRLLFVVFILSSFLVAQEEIKYTDISPDGKSKVSYVKGDIKPFVIVTNTAPFGTTPSWTAGLERQIGGLAFGDYDMDGDLDLAAGCYFSNSFPPIPEYNNMIFRNDNGVLTVNPAWFSDDSRSTTDIKWADINNDGKPDLFSGNGDGGYAPSTIYLNTGSGVPTTPSFIFTGQAWTVGTARTPIVVFLNQLEPVPVELTSFSAEVGEGNVILNWSTASETNNKEFRIERRTIPSGVWGEFGLVSGAGTSTSPKTYRFNDNSTVNLSGKVQYRLNQIDFNGTNHYSNISEIDLNNISSFELFGNYPNPFNPETVIRYNLPTTGTVSLKIYDSRGGIINNLTQGIQQKGTHEIHLNMSGKSSGVYFYTLENVSTDGKINRLTGKFVMTK